MKQFLIENASWLLTLLFSAASLIVFLLKKVKIVKKDTAFERVLSLLPSLIVKAEKSISGGTNKKAFVLSMAMSFLRSIVDEDLTEDAERDYIKKLGDQIEAILLTPVKKEVVDEDKK